MDLTIQAELATQGFHAYLIRTYLKKQLDGIIRLVQARYPAYISMEQMSNELSLTQKKIADLDIEFIANESVTQTAKHKHRPRKEIHVNNRCKARVWDFNHLVWQLDGHTVYGVQCKNPKSSIDSGGSSGVSSSNYCKKHIRKLTHEDWFAEPSDKMRLHFTNAISSSI